VCGIAGLIQDIAEPTLEKSILGMVETIRHRGPDWQGIHVEAGVALAHARLSIIDLSPKARQPMISECGRYTIVYNGEVYNFPNLRSELEALGHSFRGSSDTEVILASFSEWGDEAFARWNGMFAAAIWDHKARELSLVRDRFGIKPLYFTHLSDCGLAFASEIKAIEKVPGIDLRVDPRAINEFLHYGSSLGRRSFYLGLQSLLPGHVMKFCQGQAQKQSVPYFNIDAYDASPRTSQVHNLETAAETLRVLLRKSVNRQMVSDVPIGIFLSGGLDSSAITAVAAELSSSKISTFSVGFGETLNCGELPIARRTAKRFGTDHHEILLSNTDIPDILESCIQAHDEPFGDPASLPIFQMSRAIKPYAKVVLQGDGGDEVFGGYDRYSRLQKINFFRALGLLSPIARRMGKISPKLLRAFRTVEAFNESDNNRLFAKLMSQDTFSSPSYDLLAPEIRKKTLLDDAFNRYIEVAKSLGGNDLVHTMMRIDRRVILPDIYFPKVDRNSMAQSIEVRVPLMDNELVRFMSSLPSDFTVRKGKKKFLLKYALKNQLPNEVVSGPKKGFDVPQREWMRDSLVDYFLAAMGDAETRCGDVFNFDLINHLLEQHRSHAADHGMILYKLLTFFVWVRQKSPAF